MSSAGHVWDAIKRMENNRALKKLRRSRYNEMKEAVSKVDAKYHEFKDRSKLNDQELKFLKDKIKKRIILQKQKTVLFSSLVSIIIIGLIFVLSRFLFHYFTNY